MSKFQFRLETLLKARTADRQQRSVELAQAYQAEALLKEEAQRLSQEQTTSRQVARASVASGAIDVDSLRSVHRHALLLESQARLLAQRGDQLREEIARRQAALRAADQQVKILEKLRYKQLQAHQMEDLKRELRELDDLSQQLCRNESD